MKTLVLDSAFVPIVAIIIDGKEVAENHSNSGRNSDTYMQLIDNTLKQANLSVDDIDCIAINVGPGSFTGLRVAISIAKGLGFASDMKYQTFTSFDYVQTDVQTILVPGFSNFVYSKDVAGNMNCEDVNTLNIAYNYATFCDGIFNDLVKKGYNIKLLEKLPYAKVIKTSRANWHKINELEPLYLRKSQAELQREAKNKKN